MRTTSAIQFYCRTSKSDKQGFSPVEVSLTINGKRCFFNLPRKERPRDFEKSIKSSKSDMVIYLDTIRQQINNAQTELLRNGIAVTSARLREYIKTGGIKSYTLADLVNEFMKDFEIRMKNIDTYKKYQIVFDELIDFIGGDTETNSITSGTIQKFYDMLRGKCVESTTGGKMTKIKSLMKYAFENGRMSTYVMGNIKISKGKPKKEYLKESDIKKLREKTIVIERLEKVRDLFIFQMSTGLSYVDIENTTELLRKGDIFYIKGERTKTKIPYTAVVLKEGVEIWEKYNGVLPVLSNQKYNSYLKEIQDICGIEHNLTTHLARKTYATNMLNMGIPITSVSKMLGHSNCNITQRCYVSVLDDTVLDDFKAVI